MTRTSHWDSPAKEYAMTREDFVVRWRTRLSEWARIGALVDGARVCEDVLQDFESVTRAEDDAELSLSEAAAESGYSSDHLRRLHRLSKLPASLILPRPPCRVRIGIHDVIRQANAPGIVGIHDEDLDIPVRCCLEG